MAIKSSQNGRDASLPLWRERNVPTEIEESWKQEIRRRLAEIQSGRDKGIPGEEVSARIRKIVGL